MEARAGLDARDLRFRSTHVLRFDSVLAGVEIGVVVAVGVVAVGVVGAVVVGVVRGMIYRGYL